MPISSQLAQAHARALAKAITWRLIGTIDTFIWSLLITHHPFQAGSIATLEGLTKIPLYYAHEWGWRFIRYAPDSHLRSLLKAVSWRVIGSVHTFLMSWLITGHLGYAVSIASAEALTKIVLYYLHERIWRFVRWGRLEAKPVEVAAPIAGA